MVSQSRQLRFLEQHFRVPANKALAAQNFREVHANKYQLRTFAAEGCSVTRRFRHYREGYLDDLMCLLGTVRQSEQRWPESLWSPALAIVHTRSHPS